MRVLILGEGVTDYGPTRTQPTSGESGVLPVLVRKLLNEAAPGMPVDLVIGRRPRGFHKRGFDQQLLAQLALPQGREANAIVMVVDRDGEKNKDRIAEGPR